MTNNFGEKYSESINRRTDNINKDKLLVEFSIDLAYFCHLKECIFSVKIAFLDGEPGCQTQF
jgi:hypothetical protein